VQLVQADFELDEAPALPYDPGEQGDPLHAEAPVALEKDPAGHCEQNAADDRVAPALPYNPGEQGDPLHAEAPVEPVELTNVPGEHTEHAEAPAASEKEPAAQGVQAEAPVRVKIPLCRWS